MTPDDEWVPFRYRDFYDIPRDIVVTWASSTYLFDCRYDDDLGDYPPRYEVYRLPPDVAADLDASSWIGLHERGEHVGSVATQRVRFDDTKRGCVHRAVFNELDG